MAELALKHSYRGWAETIGAIEVIRNLETDGTV